MKAAGLPASRGVSPRLATVRLVRASAFAAARSIDPAPIRVRRRRSVRKPHSTPSQSRENGRTALKRSQIPGPEPCSRREPRAANGTKPPLYPSAFEADDVIAPCARRKLIRLHHHMSQTTPGLRCCPCLATNSCRNRSHWLMPFVTAASPARAGRTKCLARCRRRIFTYKKGMLRLCS